MERVNGSFRIDGEATLQGRSPLSGVGCGDLKEKGARTLGSANKRGKKNKKSKTYNSRYSLVVTHPTTNLPI
jgi:hypothetical protein